MAHTQRRQINKQITNLLWNGNLTLKQIILGFTVWNSVRVSGTNYLAAGSDMEIYWIYIENSDTQGQGQFIFTQIKQSSRVPNITLKWENIISANKPLRICLAKAN